MDRGAGRRVRSVLDVVVWIARSAWALRCRRRLCRLRAHARLVRRDRPPRRRCARFYADLPRLFRVGLHRRADRRDGLARGRRNADRHPRVAGGLAVRVGGAGRLFGRHEGVVPRAAAGIGDRPRVGGCRNRRAPHCGCGHPRRALRRGRAVVRAQSRTGRRSDRADAQHRPLRTRRPMENDRVERTLERHGDVEVAARVRDASGARVRATDLFRFSRIRRVGARFVPLRAGHRGAGGPRVSAKGPGRDRDSDLRADGLRTLLVRHDLAAAVRAALLSAARALRRNAARGVGAAGAASGAVGGQPLRSSPRCRRLRVSRRTATSSKTIFSAKRTRSPTIAASKRTSTPTTTDTPTNRSPRRGCAATVTPATSS